MSVCQCRPSYQAQAGPRGARLTRTWPTLAAARSWKRDVERQGARAARAPRIREAAAEWLELAEAGVVRARGKRPYRPSTLRGYRQAMQAHLYGELGDVRLDQLSRGQLNRFVEGLQARGLAAQTVRNVVIPLRAIYRRAFDDGEVQSNPTVGARVPAGGGRRLVFMDPESIGPMLAALEGGDRALWATAVYAGLRRGELMGLRWADVDLAGGTITVSRSFDAASGTMGPVKSLAGQDRRVPIIAVLRDEMAAHKQRAGRAQGLVFSRASLAGHCRAASRDLPFSERAVSNRARGWWARAGVRPVTLHECRHTFASLMIAAMASGGTFDPKVLQGMLGHASITQTFDRYGHLFPGAERNAGRLLDEFLSVTQASSPVTSDPRLPSVTSGSASASERAALVPRRPGLQP